MNVNQIRVGSDRMINQRVPARDGIHLAADVYLPEGSGPWPAAVHRTPYGRAFDAETARVLSQDGMAMVSVDCRGRFDSGGEFGLGESDGADGADTLTWVAAQPWCDGRVAGRGFSYGGLTQWGMAVNAEQSLVCAAPIMAPCWWRGMSFREGGAVMLAAAAHWLPRQAAADPTCVEDLREETLSRALEFDQIIENDRVSLTAALAHRAIGRLPLRDPWPFPGSDLFAEIWRKIFDGPPPPSWIDDIGPPAGDRSLVPTLILSGWYDLGCQDSIAAFSHLMKTSPPDVASHHRLVMTAHGHGFDPLREVQLPVEAWRFGLDSDHRWAKEWLFGEDLGLRTCDPVTYFTLGANEWRGADRWPPLGAEPEPFYLFPGESNGNGVLGQAPPGKQSIGVFRYDPSRPVPSRGGAGIGLPPGPSDQTGLTGGAREDVLSLTSDPLSQNLEITGPVTAEIFASSDQPDTDFTVKLIDIDLDGRATSICDGIVRARYRNGSTLTFLRPGVVELFRVHLGDISYQVGRGHRLRADVSSSNFPRYDRNANTGAPEGTDGPGDLRVATQHIYSSPAHPSRVVLSVMP